MTLEAATATGLKPEVRGWLRHIWRKATTDDDWSRSGEPHPWWDRKSLHAYEIFTGDRGFAAERPPASSQPPSGETNVPTRAAISARTTLAEVAAAVASVGSGAASCPCCTAAA